MFSTLATILICFQIVLSSRLGNVGGDFVGPKGEADKDKDTFDSSSWDEEILDSQTICGKPVTTPNAFRRIFVSEEAEPNSWPWQVILQNDDAGDITYICGGTIISATRVITSAHFFFNSTTGKLNPTNDLFVYAGIHDIKDASSDVNTQKRKVTRISVPNGYQPKFAYSQNDIAVVHLEPPGFSFNDKVQPVCLPTSNVPEGTNCYTTGWGDLSKDQTNYYGKLHQAKLPIVSQSSCRSRFGGKILYSMVCAGYPLGDRDTCHNNKNGPLVCYRDGVWVLDGVESFGNGCSHAINLDVYTRVHRFVDWINES